MNFIKFDFDILAEKTYYYFFVKNYMEMVYSGLKDLSYIFNDKVVYDIGFGHGRAFPIYRNLGIKKVIGFEVNEADAAFAINKAERIGIDLVVRMNHDNKELFKVENESCDVVSIMYALPFVSSKIKREIIENAKRMVKPGGLVIIMDVPRPSIMSFLNTLCCMPRTFSSFKEWKELFSPMKMIARKDSNYWYFLNAPMDVLGKIFGLKTYKVFDFIAKKLGFTPSTSLMVFQK